MNPLLKFLHILSWIPVAIIKITLALLGLFVIPIALLFDKESTNWPKLFWLWGNQENVPTWWFNYVLNAPFYKAVFYRWWWYAIRNPVNNAQFIFDDPGEVNVKTNWSIAKGMEAPQMIKADQRMAYMWRWSGPFASYRRVWLNGFQMDSYSEIWFGWKVGSTVPGMGFTMQVRLNRKIGT